MKITLELNRVKVDREIPTSWSQVPFKQFLKLSDCGQDYVKILSLFLGLDHETVRKAKISGLDTVILSLNFLATQPPLEIPKTILGYDIPKDLGFETVGQFMDLKKYVETSRGLTPAEQLERYTLYCAMYATKPYDWQKAEAMAEQFLDAPASEVLAVGHFTLMKLIGLTAPMQKHSPKANTRWKSFRQALTVWLRNTGVMLRYYFWKKRQDLSGQK